MWIAGAMPFPERGMGMSSRLLLILTCLLPLATEASTFGFSWDNDLFVGSDGQ